MPKPCGGIERITPTEGGRQGLLCHGTALSDSRFTRGLFMSAESLQDRHVYRNFCWPLGGHCRVGLSRLQARRATDNNDDDDDADTDRVLRIIISIIIHRYRQGDANSLKSRDLHVVVARGSS